MRLVEAYITYIVNNISRKNLKSYTAELQEVTSPDPPFSRIPLGSPQSDAAPLYFRPRAEYYGLPYRCYKPASRTTLAMLTPTKPLVPLQSGTNARPNGLVPV